MERETERISFIQILNKFEKIIIPDIQRDYVMGSGGKKLVKLFDTMAESNEKNKEFNFGCLVGYKDENNNLFIYDGQQRLATLVCLCSFLNKDTDKTKLLKKFSFTKRDIANKWIQEPQYIKEGNAVDFTTYSLAKLIYMFNDSCLIGYCKPVDKIDLDFLFNHVYFNMVLVKKISDAEQFFLDINDGLDLKYYEIYKAEFYHHASQILDDSNFKYLALKFENEWLKFFLDINNGLDLKYNEEEMLVYFLQYCFRMMWIEEKGNDDKFKILDISWLKKEHLKRIEKIIDAVIYVTKDVSTSEVFCINYSDNNSKRAHWNINDTNYVSMLKVFLENINNAKEINKDIIIWCYISKLPNYIENKNILNKYLRFVKKLLNNSRSECETARIEFNKEGVDAKKIVYVRYYVKGIPSYYVSKKDDEYEYEDEYDKDFFYAIIVMNKKVLLNENFLDNICLEKYENELLENILKKEKKKQNSSDRKIIEKYENLPFINGLVDNFIDYTADSCQLKEWVKNSLEKININTINNQYKEVLRCICENKIDIYNCIFSNIKVSWDNYGGTYNDTYASVIVHTLCDLFTNKNGIKFSENNCLDYLPVIPDGWIYDKKIFQPMDANINNKHGFAAYSLTFEVFNMNDFLSNFSWICKSKEEKKYIINGEEKDHLPDCLKKYNKNNFILDRLSNTEKVFYSDKEYKNNILLYRFKTLLENEGVDVDSYLKNHANKIAFKIMNGKKFFINLKEI